MNNKSIQLKRGKLAKKMRVKETQPGALIRKFNSLPKKKEVAFKGLI